MQRYFVKDNYSAGEMIYLTGDDYHHAAHVMRMKVGDECFLTFEDSVAIVGEMVEIIEDTLIFKEIRKESQEKELPYDVTIACAYTKGDKLEFVAQKATELGMTKLIGFPGKTSVAKWDEKKLTKKVPRFEKIVKEAAEQSHRQKVPAIELLPSFKQLITQLADYDKILVAYEESAKEGETKSLVKALQTVSKNDKVLIIFGPEGGIAPDEIKEFEKNNAILCGLGPRILRAETAPLYALSAMSYQWELLN